MCSSTVAYEQCSAALPTMAGEKNLVAAAIQGDTDAFEVLALRHRRIVMAMMRRMTGSLEEAEDLTQQALMKAFAKIATFGGRCSFSTWLVSIAMNEARMWGRKAWKSREVRMSELCKNESLDIQVEFTDSRPGPEATYFEKELKRLLFSELKRLTPAIRVAVQVCDLEERPSEEVAPVLGISVNAVKSRRHRARAILRSRMAAKLTQMRHQEPGKTRR